MTMLQLVTLLVDDYDRAIEYFLEKLGFDLIEDAPTPTNDGRMKRWVVVRPPQAATGVLLARADTDEQARAMGRQAGDRVGFFLNVDEFDAAYDRMRTAGVEFVTAPRAEKYGKVAVFIDIVGNRWDLIGAP